MVVSVASGTAGATDSKVVPANLVGWWSRNVEDATFPFPGVWSMVIKKNGTVAFYQPGGSSVDFTTTFDATVNGRLNVGTVPICPTKAVYRWKTSGKRLTITKVSDKQCTTESSSTRASGSGSNALQSGPLAVRGCGRRFA